MATLTVAAGGTLLLDGPVTATLAAVALGIVGVALGTTLHLPFDRPRRAALHLGGSITAYTVAMWLTGGVTSTFTILPLAAIFLAAAGGGARYAVPTAIGGIVGLMGADRLAGLMGDPADLVRIPAIYAVTALAFSEIQRALTSETERTADLIFAADAAHVRKERLTATHQLLADLVEVAQSPDVNAISTGQDAVRDVALIVPGAPTRIVTSDGAVLARRGTTPPHPAARQFPVMCSGEQVARLELWDGAVNLDAPEVEAIARALEPVGLAIENDAMLQRLAGITMQRERVRLARELHDDVTPAIAAVGLALDMALISGDLDDEQARNLSATRSNVSRLVDQIRERVQDLRADRSLSVVEMAHSLVAEVDADGPTVLVSIDERMPPRPAIAAELGAFLAEAFRNALDHAGATAIWVTGRITDHDGFLAVRDDGCGFDAEAPAEGRFGLVGMQERAAILTATFELDTAPGEGTVVSLTWENGDR